MSKRFTGVLAAVALVLSISSSSTSAFALGEKQAASMEHVNQVLGDALRSLKHQRYVAKTIMTFDSIKSILYLRVTLKRYPDSLKQFKVFVNTVIKETSSLPPYSFEVYVYMGDALLTSGSGFSGSNKIVWIDGYVGHYGIPAPMSFVDREPSQ